MAIYPIPYGLYCVPAAMAGITGEPVDAVIFPTLNRASRRRDTLIGTVGGVSIYAIEEALTRLRWRVLRYKGGASGPLRVRVSTWAARSSERYTGVTLLVCTSRHCLVALDGKVYDNHVPHGVLGEEHPFAKAIVTYAAAVRKV
jgi:hypothetical protein